LTGWVAQHVRRFVGRHVFQNVCRTFFIHVADNLRLTFGGQDMGWEGVLATVVEDGDARVFVVLYEEPVLRGTFGAEFDAYCARVPRWIPRRPASG
jgi:protein-S-isoprenylcysteine O-methyltransferase Ste14